MTSSCSDHFNHIFAAFLSAFHKGYICQWTLLNMIEHFKCALDRGEYITCISMDISEAFDCLPHSLTICKLHAYGLSRHACTLIACYWYQHKQRVKIGNVKSEWQEISKGIPRAQYWGHWSLTFSSMIYFILWNMEIYSTMQVIIQGQ